MSDALPRAAAVVWLRRDLRLHDHPAFHAALADGRVVVPLFVLDPRLLTGRFASPNRTWFLLGSLRALRDDLRSRGSDLVVRVGDPRVEVPAVARSIGAGQVLVSRDHAPYGRARDRAVVRALAELGIDWRARRGTLVHEPEELTTLDGGPFRVYSPFRRAWAARERRRPLDAPSSFPALPGDLDVGPIPTLAALGLGEGPTADPGRLPEPGEAAARRRLERWLDDRVEHYATSRDALADEEGTSRLSADLHLGLLSPAEVVERVVAGDGARAGRRTFVNELVWREFYAHVLFHDPGMRHHAVDRELDALPFSDDERGLAAWEAGRTGYPLVDAGMRQLAAMGWMHNRARMVTASFLTKHLLIDWRRGEAHFMRHLVDGDVASNNGGWQWSASTGTDGQPWFRIINPILQAKRFDPDGTYVRRWVPELADVPTENIHEPWRMSADEQRATGCRIGVDYPAPIVDHLAARARTLAVYRDARRTS
jgi:deoxyribodipyrimidine photo-lyase